MSEAMRSQGLDHQDHGTFLKYQSELKALDIQALFHDMEPDYGYFNVLSIQDPQFSTHSCPDFFW